MELYSQPIPDTRVALQRLKHPEPARQHLLHLDDIRNEEELVRADHFGIAGVSYYARKNAFIGEPIMGAKPEVWIRRTVAQKLAAINDLLKHDPDLKAHFKKPVRLWINEGFRDVRVQNYIHDIWFPRWYKKHHPGKSENAMEAARSIFIARGTEAGQEVDPMSPPPHYTGGAVDVRIEYVDGSPVEFGHTKGKPGETNRTDFYEDIAEVRLTKKQRAARDNRRILYWLMQRQRFANNPNEWWHFSLGDQMWARLHSEPFGYYSIPPNIPKMDIKL